MHIIGPEQAWQAVLSAARNEPPAGARPLAFPADGCWSATCPVSSAATGILNALAPVVCHAGRYVIAQLGQSLDGRIATASGHSHYITGVQSRQHLHRLRAVADAVVVGVGTVIADNPRLTVRHVAGPSPVRVVLDPHGRAPADRRVFTDGGPPTWHVVRPGAQAAAGALPMYLDERTGMDVPHQVLALLAAQGLQRILIEGGGVTVSRFIAAGCVDRLHLVVAPFVIGSGRAALQLPVVDTLDQALRPAWRCHALGEDRLYDLDFSGVPGSPNTST